jgi:hypothetical protein
VPATLYPQEDSSYSFLLEAGSGFQSETCHTLGKWFCFPTFLVATLRDPELQISLRHATRPPCGSLPAHYRQRLCSNKHFTLAIQKLGSDVMSITPLTWVHKTTPFLSHFLVTMSHSLVFMRPVVVRRNVRTVTVLTTTGSPVSNHLHRECQRRKTRWGSPKNGGNCATPNPTRYRGCIAEPGIYFSAEGSTAELLPSSQSAHRRQSCITETVRCSDRCSHNGSLCSGHY